MAPNGWEISQLKDLLEGSIKNGFSPNPADSNTGFWVLGLGALGEDGIIASEIKPVVPQDKVLKNLLAKDDFLVSRSNTPDKVGRSVRFRGEVENCSYPDLMMRFRIDQRKANKSFIEQQLKSSKVRTYFKNCAAGSSSTMVKINKGILEKTPIPTPPLPEQKKIAQILSTWDKAITTTEQLLANSQQQKKALMQQLLTSKKRLLDKNGVRFEGEWRKLPFSDLVSLVKTKFDPKANADDMRECIELEHIAQGSSSLCGSTNTTVAVSTKTAFEKGDVLFGKLRPYLRKYWKADRQGVCSTEIWVFRTKAKVAANYISQVVQLDSFIEVANKSSGTHMPRADWNVVKDFLIPTPPLQEQQKIAAVLSTADQEITALKQKLDALKQEKKALMQQLLTGKRRVKVEEAA